MMLVGRGTKALFSMLVFGMGGLGGGSCCSDKLFKQDCHDILAVCQYSHQYSYQPYMYLFFMIKMCMKGQE